MHSNMCTATYMTSVAAFELSPSQGSSTDHASCMLLLPAQTVWRHPSLAMLAVAVAAAAALYTVHSTLASNIAQLAVRQFVPVKARCCRMKAVCVLLQLAAGMQA